jgi:predicted ATP-grasp superfamily ATP-dependent carboligase
MSELTILVTDGETRAALAAVRALGAVGYTVHVLGCTPRPLAGASRHAVATHRLCDGAVESDRFATEVADLVEKIDADLVLPVGEVSLGALYAYPTLRPEQIVAADRSSFDRAVDKHALLLLAEELGLDVPLSRLVEGPETLRKLPAGFSYPVVLKARRSRFRIADGWQTGGVHILQGPEDLERARCDPGFGGGALLQEHIEGHGEAIFLLRDGESTRAVFAHRRLREKPPTGGVSVLRESIAPDPVLLEGSERLLAALDWHGVAMVEFRRGRDGRAVLMEINPRLWGSLQLATDAEVDFTTMLIRQHLGQTIDAPNPQLGVRCRWLLGDFDHLLICLRRPAARAVTGRGALRVLYDFLASFWDGSRLEVLRLDDPRPFLRELSQWWRN